MTLDKLLPSRLMVNWRHSCVNWTVPKLTSNESRFFIAGLSIPPTLNSINASRSARPQKVNRRYPDMLRPGRSPQLSAGYCRYIPLHPFVPGLKLAWTLMGGEWGLTVDAGVQVQTGG